MPTYFLNHLNISWKTFACLPLWGCLFTFAFLPRAFCDFCRMKIKGKPYRTIWLKPEYPSIVQIIDQRYLPHEFVIAELKNAQDAFTAIRDMAVRGAPLIGSAAAYGMYLAALSASETDFDKEITKAAEYLKSSRPTAVNLAYALDRILAFLSGFQGNKAEKESAILQLANDITEESLDHCRSIGEFGLEIINELFEKKKSLSNDQTLVINILTHCNAGWLACIDYGTATAPIYFAHDAGIPIHVWVGETRPRNQGASLTAFELMEHGVPHTVIADNTGGHLMQHGLVDMVIVGTDRTTRSGDVANKIGTYLKALAAKDNGIPFYVAAPSSSIDWNIRDGIKEIPIEQRNADEVRKISGKSEDGKIIEVLLTPQGSPAANFAFDVTPSRLITGIITERGICAADEASLVKLFPEHRIRNN